MTRMQTLLVTTVLAAAVPLATAMAQSSTSSCGPEAWSSAKMGYTRTPCNAGDATAQVGTSGPTAYGSGNSSSMTKAQMKQPAPSGYMQPSYAPMRSQAVVAEPANASMMGNQSCGPSNAVAITDEYGHKYNCRGDRIRR
ncbi:MAG: hypothetical protein JSS04_23390 [Proteobacteria bacterium]|nr:hypothetical protein [Pseudomonadota bacterium]